MTRFLVAPETRMMRFLVVASLTTCLMTPVLTSDPLLLEYSDYYYDLYYGDYDNYDASGTTNFLSYRVSQKKCPPKSNVFGKCNKPRGARPVELINFNKIYSNLDSETNG